MVFDEAVSSLDDGEDSPFQGEQEAPKKGKRKIVSPSPSELFEASPEDIKRDEDRKNNRLVGLLIGPKNLEKLRAFGFDVVKVSDGSLEPGVAHRGMTE